MIEDLEDLATSPHPMSPKFPRAVSTNSSNNDPTSGGAGAGLPGSASAGNVGSARSATFSSSGDNSPPGSVASMHSGRLPGIVPSPEISGGPSPPKIKHLNTAAAANRKLAKHGAREAATLSPNQMMPQSASAGQGLSVTASSDRDYAPSHHSSQSMEKTCSFHSNAPIKVRPYRETHSPQLTPHTGAVGADALKTGSAGEGDGAGGQTSENRRNFFARMISTYSVSMTFTTLMLLLAIGALTRVVIPIGDTIPRGTECWYTVVILLAVAVGVGFFHLATTIRAGALWHYIVIELLTADDVHPDKPKIKPRSYFFDIYAAEYSISKIVAALEEIRAFLPPGMFVDEETELEHVDTAVLEASTVASTQYEVESQYSASEMSPSARTTTSASTATSSNLASPAAGPRVVKAASSPSRSRKGSAFTMLSGRSGGASSLHSHHSRRMSWKGPSLEGRRCALCLIDWSGFNKLLGSAPLSQLVQMHGEYIDIVCKVFRGVQGVVGSFQGDKILGSWNVLGRPQPMFMQMACSAAVQLERALAEWDAGFNGVSNQYKISVVAGDAYCGHLGCRNMRAFTVVGPLVNWCYALNRLCGQLRCPVLMDELVYNTVHVNFASHVVERADISSVWGTTQTRYLYRILAEINITEEQGEWMYALQENDYSHYEPFNKGFRQVYDGHYGDGFALIAPAVKAIDRESTQWQALQHLMTQVAEQTGCARASANRQQLTGPPFDPEQFIAVVPNTGRELPKLKL